MFSWVQRITCSTSPWVKPSYSAVKQLGRRSLWCRRNPLQLYGPSFQSRSGKPNHVACETTESLVNPRFPPSARKAASTIVEYLKATKNLCLYDLGCYTQSSFLLWSSMLLDVPSQTGTVTPWSSIDVHRQGTTTTSTLTTLDSANSVVPFVKFTWSKSTKDIIMDHCISLLAEPCRIWFSLSVYHLFALTRKLDLIWLPRHLLWTYRSPVGRERRVEPQEFGCEGADIFRDWLRHVHKGSETTLRKKSSDRCPFPTLAPQVYSEASPSSPSFLLRYSQLAQITHAQKMSAMWISRGREPTYCSQAHFPALDMSTVETTCLKIERPHTLALTQEQDT